MINYLSAPFKWFFKLESASGLLLLIAAIVALLLSNSNLADYYFDTINAHILIGTKNFGLDFSALHWINDVLMCVFFFVVTYLTGLRSFRLTFLTALVLFPLMYIFFSVLLRTADLFL